MKLEEARKWFKAELKDRVGLFQSMYRSPNSGWLTPIEEVEKNIEALKTALSYIDRCIKSPVIDECEWLYSAEFYSTQCGMEFCFQGFGKKKIDKNYEFCPHCGKKIVVKQWLKEGEERCFPKKKIETN